VIFSETKGDLSGESILFPKELQKGKKEATIAQIVKNFVNLGLRLLAKGKLKESVLA